MDKKVIILVAFFCWALHSFSQQIQESYAWDSTTKLTWKNFKGAIPLDADAAATTASGISYKYAANLLHHEVKIDAEVTAFFYPNESWYKPNECDDYILEHEQLHFDIAELFARKMRIRLNNTSFSDNVKAEIRNIYNEILQELSDLQEQYDLETNFSRNRDAQLRWNAQIFEALEKIN